MTAILRGTDARLVVLDDGVDDATNVAFVAPAVATGTPTALFVLYPETPSEAAVPVHLVGTELVPATCLVLPAPLAQRVGAVPSRTPWELRRADASLVADEVTLEVTGDFTIQEIAQQLQSSQTLDGSLLYVGRSADAAGSSSIEVDGVPVQVHRVRPEAHGETIYEIRAHKTAVTAFSPSHRSSVDVVILADCSGSMRYRDLTVDGDAQVATTSLWQAVFGVRPAVRDMSRSDALAQALLDLLDRRLMAAGASGRIALVAFGTSCELRFPKGDRDAGMAEVDENTPEAQQIQFRQAIKDLVPLNWGTDIGQALQFAATHLSNYGKPGNERLIVLVSDGAHWKAKGESGAGELLDNALDEPVSLMDSLHTRMGIRLHAIGISNPAIYERWVRADRTRDPQQYLVDSLIPNHKLLEELVKVGGGDPARTGDASVLDEYMRGLGAGVSTRVTLGQARDRRPLSPTREQLEAIRRVVQAHIATQRPGEGTEDAALHSAVVSVARAYERCNSLTRQLSGGQALFTPEPDAFDRLLSGDQAARQADLRAFLSDIVRVFVDALPDEMTQHDLPVPWPAPIPAVKTLIHSSDFRLLEVVAQAVRGELKSPAKLREANQACERFAGQPLATMNMPAHGAALKRGVLAFLAELLDRVEMTLVNAPRQPQAPVTTPQDTFIQW